MHERQKSWLHPDGETAKHDDLEGEAGDRDFAAENFEGEFVEEVAVVPTVMALVE